MKRFVKYMFDERLMLSGLGQPGSGAGCLLAWRRCLLICRCCRLFMSVDLGLKRHLVGVTELVGRMEVCQGQIRTHWCLVLVVRLTLIHNKTCFVQPWCTSPVLVCVLTSVLGFGIMALMMSQSGRSASRACRTSLVP